MMHESTTSSFRTRWAAIGAAVAVTLGAGGIGITHATTGSGDKPIFTAIEPCRLVDLRPDFRVGPRPTPLGPAETFTVDGWGEVGDCDLPTGTTALSLNVTALDATLPTFLQFFPAGTDRPERGSNLNPVPGAAPTPNAVNVALSDTGEFSVYNLQGSVDLIVDVVGVYDDHHHDDRYYTKQQVEALIAGPRSIELRADDFNSSPDVQIDLMVRFNDDGNAGNDPDSGCTIALPDLPDDAEISQVTIRYAGVGTGLPWDVTADLGLFNLANAPGNYPGDSILEPNVNIQDIEVPVTDNSTIADLVVPIDDFPLGADGAIPVLSLCLGGYDTTQRVSVISVTLDY